MKGARSGTTVIGQLLRRVAGVIIFHADAERYSKTMKTTVDLPQALLAAAKDCAVASGLTLQEVIEAGLRKVLDAARGRKPFKLRKCSVGGEGLAPGMDWPRIREEIYRGRGA